MLGAYFNQHSTETIKSSEKFLKFGSVYFPICCSTVCNLCVCICDMMPRDSRVCLWWGVSSRMSPTWHRKSSICQSIDNDLINEAPQSAVTSGAIGLRQILTGNRLRGPAACPELTDAPGLRWPVCSALVCCWWGGHWYGTPLQYRNGVCRYRDYHNKDQTVSRPLYGLTTALSLSWEFLYW